MTDDLYRTAIHEAGHVVCGFCVGISFKTVSIEQDKDALGRVIPSDDNLYSPKSRGGAMAHAICGFGGCTAEAIAGYNITDGFDGAAGDLMLATEALARAFKYEDQFLRRRQRARQKAFKILLRPKNWALVEATAAALVEKKTLSFEEFGTIIEEQSKKGSAK
jgi:hypothetical protein